MTQQDVFDMAREVCGKWPSFMSNPNLQAFAKLVAAKVRKETLEEMIYAHPTAAIKQAVEYEREACAMACENVYTGEEACGDWPTPEMCADAIRARGEA